MIRSEQGFNRSDVVVGTDCGAINNMVHANHYATNDTDAAAKTLNGGTDMELGMPLLLVHALMLSPIACTCTHFLSMFIYAHILTPLACVYVHAHALTRSLLLCAYAGEQIWSSIENGGKGDLKLAVLLGYTTEARVTESVSRILHLRFITGQFDPIEDQPCVTLLVRPLSASASSSAFVSAFAFLLVFLLPFLNACRC